MEDTNKNPEVSNTRDPRKNFMHRWRRKGDDSTSPSSFQGDFDIPSPSESMFSMGSASIQSPDYLKSPGSISSSVLKSPQNMLDGSSRSDGSTSDQGPETTAMSYQESLGKDMDTITTDNNYPPSLMCSMTSDTSVSWSSKNTKMDTDKDKASTSPSNQNAAVRDRKSSFAGRAGLALDHELVKRLVHANYPAQGLGFGHGGGAAEELPLPIQDLHLPSQSVSDITTRGLVHVTDAMARVAMSQGLTSKELIVPRTLPPGLNVLSSWKAMSPANLLLPIESQHIPHVTNIQADKALNTALLNISGRHPSVDNYLDMAAADQQRSVRYSQPQRNTGKSSKHTHGSAERENSGCVVSTSGQSPSVKRAGSLSAGSSRFSEQSPAQSMSSESSSSLGNPVLGNPVEQLVAEYGAALAKHGHLLDKGNCGTNEQLSMQSLGSLATQRYHPYSLDNYTSSSSSAARLAAESTVLLDMPSSRKIRRCVSTPDLDQAPTSTGEQSIKLAQIQASEIEADDFESNPPPGEECNREVDSTRSETQNCQVCGDLSAGFHCGAHVCEACKKFFVRCIRQETGIKFVCHRKQKCVITKETRTQCQYCRFQKCINLGMYKPGGTNISSEIGHIPCKVCGAPSSGYHFGAITCEGCKGFFRRTIKERDHMKYHCAKSGQCTITMATRNMCKHCRYQKCLDVGMNPSGSRIGRQPNSIRHATLVQLQQIKTQKGLPVSNEIPVMNSIKQEPMIESGYGDLSASDMTDMSMDTAVDRGYRDPSTSSITDLSMDTDSEVQLEQVEEACSKDPDRDSWAIPRDAGHDSLAYRTQLYQQRAAVMNSRLSEKGGGKVMPNQQAGASNQQGHPADVYDFPDASSLDDLKVEPKERSNNISVSASEQEVLYRTPAVPPVYQASNQTHHVLVQNHIYHPPHNHSVEQQVALPEQTAGESHHLSLEQRPHKAMEQTQGLSLDSRTQRDGPPPPPAPHLHRLSLDQLYVQQVQPENIDAQQFSHRLGQAGNKSLDLASLKAAAVEDHPAWDQTHRQLVSQSSYQSHEETVHITQDQPCHQSGDPVPGHQHNQTNTYPFHPHDSEQALVKTSFGSQSSVNMSHDLSQDAQSSQDTSYSHPAANQRAILYQRSRSLPAVHNVDSFRYAYASEHLESPNLPPYPKGPSISSQQRRMSTEPSVLVPTQFTGAVSNIPKSSTSSQDGSPTCSSSPKQFQECSNPTPGSSMSSNQSQDGSTSCSRSKAQEPKFDPKSITSAIAKGIDFLRPIRMRANEAQRLVPSSTMLDAWEAMMAQFQSCAMATLKFAKKIPGFSKFPIKQQIAYVQENMFPIVLVQLSLDYNMELSQYNYFNFDKQEEDIIMRHFPSFQLLVPVFHSMGRKIMENNFTAMEITFLCGLIMVCEGSDSSAVEGLTFGLQKYIKDTYSSLNNKFGQILLLMAEFKKISEVHQEAVVEIVANPDKYKGMQFPQLFKETFINDLE